MPLPPFLRTHRHSLTWGSVIVITLGLVGVSRLWLELPPPSRIVMATGQPGG